MSEAQQELFEQQLRSTAGRFDYPRTPDVARAVMQRLHAPTPARLATRRVVWVVAALLVLFSSLMLIPPARAAILDFIQIGIVRIFRAEPAPVSPPDRQISSTLVPATATPVVTSQPLIPLLERLAGEMTLEEARQAVDYPLVLPTYPPDLGQPDRVFVQEAEGDMTILVWIDPQQPEEALMSLHLIPSGSWAIHKMGPRVIQETRVNGQYAVWAVGPYPLRYSNGDLDFMRLINGHVLIWTEGNGNLTYRLETGLSLEEAIRVAESLEPIRE